MNNWFSVIQRTVLVICAAGLLGWLVGYPMALVTLTLLAVLLFWLYQLYRIHSWLQHTEKEPPEAFGVWGQVFDQIYKLQRENRAERIRLQSNVEYLQSSFTSMRDGVLMVDKDGCIEWSNSAGENLFGLRYPGDRGQPLINLVRSPQFHQYFLGRDYNEPLILHHTAQQESYLQIEITRFGAGDRLVFVRDVTSTIRLEQMRRDFIGNVSHELRTPLTVITGYLDMILADDDDLPERFRRPLQQMSVQSERMENLLKDLLWLSKIESVRDEAKEDLVDVCGLLEELRDELATTHPGREIELSLETREAVLGDYRELYSAASNLVRNAIKYSREDTPVCISWQDSLSVASHSGEPMAGPVLSVKDWGLGIDAVHVPRLTERFYRVDDSRSSATGGTGLGLAIVKHVAAAHDAQLGIESVPGVGSSFSLAFPPHVDSSASASPVT